VTRNAVGDGAVTGNVIPGRYRGVSVARVGVPLDEASLREHFLGLPVYRRTRFVVATSDDAVAVLRVHRPSTEELFAPVTAVEVLAGPDECAWRHLPDVDTAVPSALAEAATREAPGVRAVVVQGRYEHVSFVLDPHPRRVVVRDVVPPVPAKLYDQARRVLDTAEDLPPLVLVPQEVDVRALAQERPSDHYLLPCRGSGTAVPGAAVSYLDEHPDEADWTLVGCERSRQIHRWFYGRDAPCVEMCPLRTAPDRSALLTKCCLQEEEVTTGPGWASVPWGASLDHVREALRALAYTLEPQWAPV
jgi:hypothetical protein